MRNLLRVGWAATVSLGDVTKNETTIIIIIDGNTIIFCIMNNDLYVIMILFNINVHVVFEKIEGCIIITLCNHARHNFADN